MCENREAGKCVGRRGNATLRLKGLPEETYVVYRKGFIQTKTLQAVFQEFYYFLWLILSYEGSKTGFLRPFDSIKFYTVVS